MNTTLSASALFKTLKMFGASVLMFAMILTAFPITAFAQDGGLEPAVVDETTETTEAPLECAEGQILNEAGDACVDEAPAPADTDEGEVQGLQTETLETETVVSKTNICHKTSSESNPWEAQRVNTSAWTDTHQGHGDFLYGGPVNQQNNQPTDDGWCEENAPEEPENPPYTYDDETEDNKCVVVSDSYTQEGGQPASIVSNPHSGWTAVVSALSKWIWGEDPTVLVSGNTEVETFTRTFTVDDVPTGATLRIAADNGYSVSINGHDVGADPEEFNYQAGHEEDYVIPAADLLEGENTITFVVTNKDVNGETPASNPGGLRYILTVDGADCGKPKNPENSCVAPSTLEVTGTQTFGGSEETLQHILDNASPAYDIDVAADQTNIQQWNGTGNTVDFSVKFIKRIASDKHVFGYKVNGGAFVPLFKSDASVGVTGAGDFSGTPVQSAAPVTFSATGVNDVVFALYNANSNTFYYTKTSSNGDGMRHAVVYNSDDNEYVIAFEDLPSQGDKDFNDLVVEVTVTDCETPDDSITVVATKIVCDDESYLPNVMGANHVTDANTAANFLAAVNAGKNAPVCRAVPNWQFEWSNNGPDGGNATTGHVDGYTTSGLTAADGTVSMTIPFDGLTEVHLREVLKPGYIPFKGGTSDNVSAEFACANDGLNYDNWDFIRSPVEGETYYCVAWNVEEEDETPICNPEINLVANGSFEAPDVTNGAGWDVFEVGTSPTLVWLADFLGAAPGGKVEIHGGVNGWLASNGSQYTELDSDLNGPSNPGGASAVEIAQGLTTVSGQKYRVSYDFSARPGTAKEQNAVTVSVNGTPMQTTNAVAATAGNQTEWSNYGFDFTAAGTLTTLALRDAGNANDSEGTFVDNVKVTCVPPETVDVCSNLEGNQAEVPEGYSADGNYCYENDGGNDDGPFNVFISKYLWNFETDTAEAILLGEGEEGPSFRMVAKYTIADFYTDESGNDGYNLDAGNGYTTNTVNLAEGDHYSTYEVTDGEVVIPTEGQCVEGKYRLVGYKVGSTMEAAEAAEITSTVPDYIIDGDEYVIVVNEDCDDTFQNPDDEIPTDDDDDNNRPGSHRRGGGGGNGGEVLGAATCGPLLSQYLHIGWNNDPAEVTKLQEFLNNQVGTNLPLSGFFGNDTFEAVKLFQKNYWEQVLKPWFGRPDSGIQNEGTPTGFVYQTTRWQINNIWCPGSEAFPVTLI